MATCRKSSSGVLNSNKNIGTELECDTQTLLNLFSGATVENQKLLAGKKVDIYCVLSSSFMPPFRIAIECKEWSRRLTRKQTSSIISEYLPLLDQKKIDQFLLVTRNGLVSNAKALFDGRRIQHFTFTELTDKIFDPTPLIDNMVNQYQCADLYHYYTPQHINAPLLNVASSRFELLYNNFIDFAVENSCVNLKTAKKEWKTYFDDENKELLEKYTPKLFEKLYQERTSFRRENAENLIIDWVKNESIDQGIALLGSYGTGKSCFAKRIAYLCANLYLKGKLGRIPILIELKEFGSHQSISGLITHELVNRHGLSNGSFELFNSLNTAGRFLIILDGFDEMKQGMTLDSLLYNFYQLSLLNKNKAKVILCGRPTIFESQAEQTRILTGELQLDQTNEAKYIQVELTPFSIDEVCNFLINYTKLHKKKQLPKIRNFVNQLKTVVNNNSEIKSLVSRPVHLPMLVAVLPRLNLHPNDLSRAKLYKEFINAIIEREMLKRRPEFQQNYSIDVRKKFAIQLAVEIYMRGESRSIKSSELPEYFFEPYVRPGYSIEAVKRDLVSACFLERKQPDILFMPHKSFLEYLVAEHVIALLEVDRSIDGSILRNLTTEILSFVFEMAKQKHWRNILIKSKKYGSLLKKIFDLMIDDGKLVPNFVEDIWMNEKEMISTSVKRIISSYYEKLNNENWLYIVNPRSYKEKYGDKRPVVINFSSDIFRFLKSLISEEDDVISVHAFRAICIAGNKLNSKELIEIIGINRLIHWSRKGWLDFLKNNDPIKKQAIKIRLLIILTKIKSSKKTHLHSGKYAQQDGFT